MKTGLMLGYWGSTGPDPATEALVAEAERTGVDSLWTSEAYGSDALTPLAWWGSRTSRLRLGTAVAQLAARTPTATAMAALTLDRLSNGRAVVGLGASGPQVVEGWYGTPYRRPLARTREYVEIVRATLRRETVASDGDHYPLPLPDGTGLGKSLRSTVRPLRDDVPILVAAEGPKNIALAAEIADGWIALFFSPGMDGWYREQLAVGFGREGARRAPDDFEVVCPVTVVVEDDVERAADRVRPALALYVGGMGAAEANFHRDAVARLGFEEACDRIQAAYLDGRVDDAVAAVPTELVEAVALVGPWAKVRDELAAWQETSLTTMLVNLPVELLGRFAEAAA